MDKKKFGEDSLNPKQIARTGFDDMRSSLEKILTDFEFFNIVAQIED